MKKGEFLSLKHIIIFILIFVLSSFLLVGVTYYSSVANYYKNFSKANHSFRVAYLELDGNTDRYQLIDDLEKNIHIKDAFLYDEYASFGVIKEYKDNVFTGEINLIGVNPGMQKVIAGDDLKENELSMICPSEFYPEIYHPENPYNYKSTIDIRDDVGKILTLNYASLKEISITLSGVFDRSFDYTDPNVCYVTHDTMRKLNDMTYKKANEDEETQNLYVLLDDINNLEVLYDYSGIQDVSIVTWIRSENLNKIMYVVSFLTIVMISLVIIVCFLFNNRQIINNYTNIGILRIVGYSKKNIKKSYYLENIMISIIAIILSVIVSQFILSNFIKWFLYDNPQLSMMNMSLDLISILLCSTIILITILLSTFISLKKIDNLDICEIVHD